MRIGARAEVRVSMGVRGRPTPYSPEYAEQAREACAKRGFQVPQLAKMFGVTQATIQNWFYSHEEFFDAYKSGKDAYDTHVVERSLLRKATGYDHEVREQRLTKDGDVVDVTKTVHVSPDTAALIFWLCNRQPQRWHQIQQKINQMILPGGAVMQQVNGGPAQMIGEGAQGGGKSEADQMREIIQTLRDSGALNVAGAIDVNLVGEPDAETPATADAAAK